LELCFSYALSTYIDVGATVKPMKSIYEVKEGNLGDTTELLVCFKLAFLNNGLRRSVKIKLKAVPLTAEGKLLLRLPFWWDSTSRDFYNVVFVEQVINAYNKHIKLAYYKLIKLLKLKTRWQN